MGNDSFHSSALSADYRQSQYTVYVRRLTQAKHTYLGGEETFHTHARCLGFLALHEFKSFNCARCDKVSASHFAILVSFLFVICRSLILDSWFTECRIVVFIFSAFVVVSLSLHLREKMPKNSLLPLRLYNVRPRISRKKWEKLLTLERVQTYNFIYLIAHLFPCRRVRGCGWIVL
jgi:hypothetical protein